MLSGTPRVAQVRLAVLGAAAAAIQTLFSRELLADFSGNEAILAFVLGAWLALTAVGAALGRRRPAENGEARGRDPDAGFPNSRAGGDCAWALLSFGPLAALGLAGARLLPRMFPAGVALGPVAALVASAGLLAPACVLSGFCFARLASDAAGQDAGGAGRIAYFVDSAGSALSGAALSLFLLGRAPPFALAAAVMLATALASSTSARTFLRWSAGVIAAVGVALAIAPVDRWLTKLQAPGLGIRERIESPYGEIVLATSRGETTVSVSRVPVASSSDRAGAEETAHLPLAFLPAPRSVAIVGVPPVGTMAQVLAHQVERLDWLLDDRALADVLAREFSDYRAAHPVIADARRWLSAHTGEYDAVLLVAPEPTSAEANRLFTAEFFHAVRGALRPGGVAAVELPGLAAYASPETRRLHSSVRRTLESELQPVEVLPAGRTLYVALPGRPAATPDPSALASALEQAGIHPVYLTRAALGQILSPQRLADAERWASLPEQPNRDLSPTTYRLALDRALAELGDMGLGTVALLAALVALAALMAFGPRRRPEHVAVLTSGATALSTQLTLMLAYQIATGALYRELGLLLAGFMAGAALGAAAAGRMAKAAVLALELAQVALALALWAALPLLVAAGPGPAKLAAFGATALAGLLPGMQFAAAARAVGGARAPGSLYAADLAGGVVASLVTLTFVVPAFGPGGALLGCAGLKLASAGLVGCGRLFPVPTREQPRAVPWVPVAFGAFLLLATLEGTYGRLYAFTFFAPYQWAAVLALLVAAAAAFETARLRAWVSAASRALAEFRERTGATVGRLFHFALLLPAAAFPIARCYFKVPFALCHVCPRQCAFGVLRPYAIPAALLANLQGMRFCERVCPLGTVQATCERLGGARARRIAALWWPRLLSLALVAVSYFLASSGRGEGVQGTGLYAALFKNAFAPASAALVAAVALLAASLWVRRPFCEALCPVGATSELIARAQRRWGALLAPKPAAAPEPTPADRRLFLRRAVAGCGVALLSAEALREFALELTEPGLGVGFRNDAPGELDRFSRPAAYAIERGELVQCALCPHACILGENDRGFCRTRVVKGGKLYTVAYGNPCAANVDPIEKKPLYHFLPRSPILSIATGGCNLRCLNCQNWEISQARPDEVQQGEGFPEQLVATAAERSIPSIAYTYSEPLIYYEYVRDTGALARRRGMKNVLVTAGYVNEAPLRELCKVVDAVTLDVKAFRDAFYREVSGARLRPVLRALEVLREEGVWTEVSFLMVPTLSDDPEEIGRFARWLADRLGADTPFHLLRFHPAHRLTYLPPTPVEAMEEARRRAMDAGLHYVYLGNVPGHEAEHTRCPSCGRNVIERSGFHVTKFEIKGGRCPCGQRIAGVFES